MAALKHTNQTYGLTAYDCGHYYMKIIGTSRAVKISKDRYDRQLESFRENRYRDSLPYVTVIHKETGRMFCLNRNYRVIETRYCAHQVNMWDGWCTTDGCNQRPEWAEGIDDSKFLAVWHYS